MNAENYQKYSDRTNQQYEDMLLHLRFQIGQEIFKKIIINPGWSSIRHEAASHDNLEIELKQS